eukprot:Skav211190  [mRNA]  locus=scaffold884:286172:287377:+ [translate_table: standard]
MQLVDLVDFLLDWFPLRKKSRLKNLTSHDAAYKAILSKVVDVLVFHLELFLKYHLDTGEFDTDVPALKRQRTCKVGAETIWDLFQLAKNRRRSLFSVIAYEKNRKRTNVKDVSPESSKYWLMKLQGLYLKRCVGMIGNIKQLNLVSDASTHSGKDILVSLAYSHCLDEAAVCQIQQMTTGPLLPSELSDLGSFVASAKKCKVERVASFRQIQAINHQLSLLSNGNMSLDSLEIPESLGCRPLNPGERRIVSQDPNQTKAIMAKIKKVNGTEVPVLPEGPEWHLNMPLLTLNLDQGATGTAGVAFLMQNHMIHCKCDKIHRAIRDYKLALVHCLEGLFLKTQLHSSYLFSLNYKPFNKGNFHDKKMQYIEKFVQSTNLDCIVRVWLFDEKGSCELRYVNSFA